MTPCVTYHWKILLLITEKAPPTTTVPEAIKDRPI